MVSPLELTARLCENEVELSWESRLLNEEQDSVVDVLSEQLLESRFVVSGLLLL